MRESYSRTLLRRYSLGDARLTVRRQGEIFFFQAEDGIRDPQGAIVLGTPLLGIQGMIGRAPQRAIGLRRKRRAGKAPGKRRTSPLGRAIDDHRRRLFRPCRLDGRRRIAPTDTSTYGTSPL